MHSLFPSTTETTMTTSTPWWLVMLAGIAAFLVGLLLLISPGMTLLVLVQILGAYWLVTGILSLVHLCIDRTLWGWKLVSRFRPRIPGHSQYRFWNHLAVQPTYWSPCSANYSRHFCGDRGMPYVFPCFYFASPTN